ncbi:hypothetical protein H0H92_012949, partial [Tricholoma furcatifolium]
NDYNTGGGFIPGGSPYAGGSPGTGRNKEASHSIRPLTVTQLLKATQLHADAEWTVDDVEIGHVTTVGQVTNVQVQTTNVLYGIDDGSGQIEARHWVDSSSEEDSAKWDGIELVFIDLTDIFSDADESERMYVRVTGTLKTFGSKRYINATHIRAVTNPHELYFHLLEAMSITLMADRGFSSAPSSGATTAMGSSVSAYTGQASKMSDQWSHLPPLQQNIVRFIASQPRSDEGVHVSVIARATGTDGDAQKISDALDKLMDDGHVFSTIDDSHFNVST